MSTSVVGKFHKSLPHFLEKQSIPGPPWQYVNPINSLKEKEHKTESNVQKCIIIFSIIKIVYCYITKIRWSIHYDKYESYNLNKAFQYKKTSYFELTFRTKLYKQVITLSAFFCQTTTKN